MPTLFLLFGFRFFYRLYDLVNEPLHVHVSDNSRKLCKFWIYSDGSVQLADNVGFNKRELTRIEKALVEHRDKISQTYESDCKANGVTPNYKRKGR
ncbi:hypothetical protein GCM10023189_08850 [Nibrella saemangeumensis]|uniref:DUF4160 domain-containing protein n=1 Tax=Nibrella saemangeumensis TaxID=1084526 RepID=A0ABP8MIQ1_9BACT